MCRPDSFLSVKLFENSDFSDLCQNLLLFILLIHETNENIEYNGKWNISNIYIQVEMDVDLYI